MLLLVNGFVRSEAALATDLQAAADVSGESIEHGGMSYGRMLARLADAQRFPAIHRLIASGVFDQPGDANADFDFGLQRILDGVEALVRARQSGSPPATRAAPRAPRGKKSRAKAPTPAQGRKGRAPRER